MSHCDKDGLFKPRSIKFVFVRPDNKSVIKPQETEMKYLAILVIPFIPMTFAWAEGSVRDEVLAAIQKKPKCDEAKLSKPIKDLKLDSDLVVEAANVGCAPQLLTPYGPPDSADKTEIENWRSMLGKAEKTYVASAKYKLKKYKAILKSNKANSPAIDNDEAYAIGHSLGFFEALSKATCEHSRFPGGKETQVCKQLSDVQAALSLMNEVGDLMDRQAAKAKAKDKAEHPNTGLAKFFDMEVPAGKCAKVGEFTLRVAQNLGKKTYLTHGYATIGAGTVILKTHKHEFNSRGAVADGFGVKYKGVMSVPMADGFSQDVDVLEECN